MGLRAWMETRRERQKAERAALIAERSYYEVQAQQMGEVSRLLTEASSLQSLRDDDEEDWIPLSGEQTGSPFTADTLSSIRAKCRELVRTQPTARAVVRTAQKYVVGPKGMILGVDGVESELRDEILARKRTWNDRHRYWQHQLEVAKRYWTEGDVFVRYHLIADQAGNPELALRFINPDHIRDPEGRVSYGVRTDPEDVQTVLAYLYAPPPATSAEEIPAAQINHLKAESESDIKRGLPPLYTIRQALLRYDTWLQYRMALNKARAAIVFVRRHKGARPADVRSFKRAQRTEQKVDRKGNTVAVERLRPGTIIDATEGTEYEFKAPNVNAADVKDDGRAVILQAAAGSGFAEYMLTGDASNANYASTMVSEAPAVREAELEQGILADYLARDAREWLKVEVRAGRLPEMALQASLTYEGAAIVSRDPEKSARANETLYANDVISLQTWRQREGIDDDQERDRIDHERASELYEPGA